MKKSMQTESPPAHPSGEAGFASSPLGRDLRQALSDGSASNRRVADFLRVEDVTQVQFSRVAFRWDAP